MSSALDSLKQFTTVVSDSGDFESIAQYKPQDATTNPSLILAAVKQEKYAKLLAPAVEYGKSKGGSKAEIIAHAQDRLLVLFGQEILKLVPGRVSTEVDATLSFNTQGTIDKALQIIKLYEENGISKERVLIKIASTFDGIQAARTLEKEHGVHCNLTLLFGFGQAVACAEAGVTLISPFVGRILDWYKAATGQEYTATTDPGVASVKKIYTYYKQHGYKTVVMGASFRNVGEIEELAGCDFLTIAPKLLEQLKESSTTLERKLSPDQAKAAEAIPKTSFIDDRAAFELALFEDQMAFDKLYGGIRGFANDTKTLQSLIAAQL